MVASRRRLRLPDLLRRTSEELEPYQVGVP